MTTPVLTFLALKTRVGKRAGLYRLCLDMGPVPPRMATGVLELNQQLGEGIVLRGLGTCGKTSPKKFKDPSFFIEGCYYANTTSTHVATGD